MKQSKWIDPRTIAWRKSSYSNGDGGDCVEVGVSPVTFIPVRDSKNPGGSVLLFQRSAWAPFLDALKNQ
ncbi:DUF397 domain-containing protein [Streptomyces sp. NRRL S-340]|uniref:DUF397 domain-containing protein n=1 Tax=Streptomyces sp. NRRL S-340 TaxID=1463901 RepID=UPI00099C29B6|nr:DUF397 domain-containing protein [Streptomyces sp. NRRL S-340]